MKPVAMAFNKFTCDIGKKKFVSLPECMQIAKMVDAKISG
jgi:hypothetical protein